MKRKQDEFDIRRRPGVLIAWFATTCYWLGEAWRHTAPPVKAVWYAAATVLIAGLALVGKALGLYVELSDIIRWTRQQ